VTTPSRPTMPALSLSWRTFVLFLLTLAIFGLCVSVALPFLPAITGAVALAVTTRTPYDWLARRVRHRTLTAALGVLLAVLLIIGPSILLVQALGSQVVSAAGLVQSGAAQDWVTDTINRIPWLNHVVDKALGVVNLQQAARGSAGFIAAKLRQILTGSVSTATQVVLMLFTLFFLFRDRDQAAQAFRTLLPLNESQRDYLLGRMSNTIEATLQGSLTISGIQGALGGIMFWILGVPSALVWALVMAILATIPSLGTFLVWMPVAIYLAVVGHWVKALILVAWGTSVIGTVDNLLYPTLVGSKMQLHTVPVLFAVLGGIGLFGVSGIVLGPLLLTTMVALLRIWNPVALDTHETVETDQRLRTKT
jgi:predicted PurR-regulated permease PerM